MRRVFRLALLVVVLSPALALGQPHRPNAITATLLPATCGPPGKIYIVTNGSGPGDCGTGGGSEFVLCVCNATGTGYVTPKVNAACIDEDQDGTCEVEITADPFILFRVGDAALTQRFRVNGGIQFAATAAEISLGPFDDTDTGLRMPGNDDFFIETGGRSTFDMVGDTALTETQLDAGTLTLSTTDDFGFRLVAILNDTSAGGATEVWRAVDIAVTSTDVTGWDELYLIDTSDDATRRFAVDLDGTVTVAPLDCSTGNQHVTTDASSKLICGADVGAFSDAADPVVLNDTAKDVSIGPAHINTSKLSVEGDVAGNVTLTVQGATGQSVNILEIEQQDGTVIASIDQDGLLALARQTNPCLTWGDSDATDNDDNADLCLQLSATASGAEDGDVTWQTQIAGTPTKWFGIDADVGGAGGPAKVEVGVDATNGTVELYRRGVINDGTNTVALALSGDRIFHDTDNDGTKDAGEEFVDQGATCSYSFNVEAAATGDDGNFQAKVMVASTLVRISCSTTANAADVQFYERVETSPNTGTTSMLTSNLTCNSDTTADATTAFADSAVAADSVLALGIKTSTLGATDILRVFVECTVD